MYWNDAGFKDKLITLLCRDRNFLKRCAHLLSSKDFKPRSGESNERWLIAGIALDYYEKYSEPINSMLKVEVLDHVKRTRMSDRQTRDLLYYVKKIRKATMEAVEAIEDKVTQYKAEKLKAQVIEEMFELHSRGKLDDDKYLELCQKGIESTNGNAYRASDFFSDEDLEHRIVRRKMFASKKFPFLFIDPLDRKVRAVGRGHLGLIIGPPKGGKTLGLCHISVAYAIQGLNVLHFSLEDPRDDVEDRMDAMITNLPVKSLSEVPDKLKERFRMYRRLVKGRIKIVDGTEGGLTVRAIEQVYEAERNKGFHADALIIDYDDEIVPKRKQKERRLEFADIYRDLRQCLSRHQLIGWTAAQSKRKTDELKVITMNAIAEDISKIRKVTMAVSLGKGDWGDHSTFLYIAVHRNDRMRIGWNIISNPDRMLFFDREETHRHAKAELEALRSQAEKNPLN